MDMKQLQAFVRVAELSSFSKAATALDSSQSALSRQVRQLEIELGRHLLHRNGRGVTVTAEGERFLARSAGILRQLEAAREELHAADASPVGQVVVGLPLRIASQLAAGLVLAFRERYPKAVIRIVEGPTAAITDWILLGRVDLGLLNNPNATPQLHSQPVYAEDFHLIGSRPRPPAAATVRVRDLHRYPLILPARPHPVRQLIEEVCDRRKVTLDIAQEIDTIEAILQLIQRGLGYGILARNNIPESREFTTARITAPSITNRLVVGTAAQRPLSVVVRRTAELLLEQARAAAPADAREPA
ncbi:MAG TPA: LysR substrate-binding domain-containing protein [Steroidobacteraceae bacterium]|nr:LysR substrate-binding domain-containing protein [Steroidobacteraceae bacterium]